MLILQKENLPISNIVCLNFKNQNIIIGALNRLQYIVIYNLNAHVKHKENLPKYC